MKQDVDVVRGRGEGGDRTFRPLSGDEAVASTAEVIKVRTKVFGGASAATLKRAGSPTSVADLYHLSHVQAVVSVADRGPAAQADKSSFDVFTGACCDIVDGIFTDPVSNGFEPNFLDQSVAGGTENLNPIHKTQLLSRLCVVFDKFMQDDSVSGDLLTIKNNLLDPDTVLSTADQKTLMEHLSTKVLKGDDGAYLFTDKLLTKNGIFLELPGKSATPSGTEENNNKLLVDKLGIPKLILTRREGKHETYKQTIIEDDPEIDSIKQKLDSKRKKIEKQKKHKASYESRIVNRKTHGGKKRRKMKVSHGNQIRYAQKSIKDLEEDCTKLEEDLAEKSFDIGNLFGGGFQGVNRYLVNDLLKQEIETGADGEPVLGDDGKPKMVDSKHFREMISDEGLRKKIRAQYGGTKEGDGSVIKLNTGGLAFIAQFNQAMYDRGVITLGSEIMGSARDINSNNEKLGKKHGFEGFTAGVSGNALHYVLAAKQWCDDTGEEFNVDKLKETCIQHLVGDSYKEPVHHSLPEVVLGFNFGLMFIDNGFDKDPSKTEVFTKESFAEKSTQLLSSLGGEVVTLFEAKYPDG